MGDKELNKLLIKVSKENCRKSFDRIFDYYYPKLVDFAYFYFESREPAEEAVSDVLLKLFVKRHSMLIIEKPEAYLYRAVKNQSISYLRKSKKDYQLFTLNDPPVINKVTEPGASPERKFIQEEFYVAVKKIIDKMPPRRKMIFKLVKQEGKSYKDVAQLLNISVKTVEVHMGLALTDIRESLEKYDRQNDINYLRIIKSLLLFSGTLFPNLFN